MATCFSTATGAERFCFSTSTMRSPCARAGLGVGVQIGAELCEGLQLAVLGVDQLQVPATFFMALIWALPPTRDTEIPGLTAGMTPEWNSSVSRKIWPSVMEMTLVGM